MIGTLILSILAPAFASEPAGAGSCPLTGAPLEIVLSNPRTAERYDLRITAGKDCSVAIHYSVSGTGAEPSALERSYPAEILSELWPILGDAIEVKELRSDRPCAGQRTFTVTRGKETRRFCGGSENARRFDAFRGEIQLLLRYR